MTKWEWLQTSWTWKIGRRVLARARQRCDQAARDSVSWKVLARVVGGGLTPAVARQAMGYVIAGGLCGVVGLMVFGSRSLAVRDVAVRGLLFLFVVGVIIRCVGSVGR